MKIEVSVLVEVGMDGHSHVVTEAEHGTESVGARAQVCDGAQVFHTQSFLLQRVLFRVGCAVHQNAVGLNLAGLSGAHTLDERSFAADTRTRGHGLQLLFAEFSKVRHNLDVLDGAAVIEGNETDVFVPATAANPAFDAYFLSIISALERIYDNCSVHCFDFKFLIWVQSYKKKMIYANKMREKCKLFKFVQLFEAFIGGVSLGSWRSLLQEKCTQRSRSCHFWLRIP